MRLLVIVDICQQIGLGQAILRFMNSKKGSKEKKMENKEQVYSRAGEKYGSYKDLMDDLKEFYFKGEEVEVFEADKVEFKHSDFIDVDDLIYDMQTSAADECGEVAEEYLNELTDTQKMDLEHHIAEWFNKHAKLNFYGVENARKIMVIVE